MEPKWSSYFVVAVGAYRICNKVSRADGVT